MFNKKKVSAKPALASAFVQEPFFTTEELGVCSGCPRYDDEKPHRRSTEGLRLKCKGARATVFAMVALTTHEECEHYQK
jgi:hypothetical protein